MKRRSIMSSEDRARLSRGLLDVPSTMTAKDRAERLRALHDRRDSLITIVDVGRHRLFEIEEQIELLELDR